MEHMIHNDGRRANSATCNAYSCILNVIILSAPTTHHETPASFPDIKFILVNDRHT